MRNVSARTGLVAAFALGVAACASSDEWAEWKRHPSHFASTDHGVFSIRNRDSSAGHVTRQDIVLARDQVWWGKPITVSQNEILEK